MMRWTQEQVDAYNAKLRGRGASAEHDVKGDVSRPVARAVTRRGSPLETELHGHLTMMQLAPEAQHKFHPERKWRLDFAFPDVLVGVEIDGDIFAAENGATAGKHARGAGRCKDMEKRNAAGELGWLILNYGPPHVRSGEAALQIERIVTAKRAAAPLVLVRERDGVPVQKVLEHEDAG